MAERRETEATRMKLTYDDFVHFPDDGMRHELIDGEHDVTPAPNRRHQQLLGRLYLAVGNWLEEHPVGAALLSPFDVVFTRFDVVEPDLLFVSSDRTGALLTEKHAIGADLVVEIGSPGSRRHDETVKLRLYERAGVSEYWFVDPDECVIRVYARSGERFVGSREYSAERAQVPRTPLMPGFELACSEPCAPDRRCHHRPIDRAHPRA